MRTNRTSERTAAVRKSPVRVYGADGAPLSNRANRAARRARKAERRRKVAAQQRAALPWLFGWSCPLVEGETVSVYLGGGVWDVTVLPDGVRFQDGSFLPWSAWADSGATVVHLPTGKVAL